jgi:hypothetical protein
MVIKIAITCSRARTARCPDRAGGCSLDVFIDENASPSASKSKRVAIFGWFEQTACGFRLQGACARVQSQFERNVLKASVRPRRGLGPINDTHASPAESFSRRIMRWFGRFSSTEIFESAHGSTGRLEGVNWNGGGRGQGKGGRSQKQNGNPHSGFWRPAPSSPKCSVPG